MITENNNPKALQLAGLDAISKKVTIGFKCNPKVKLQLAKDAKNYGLTLSEYVENLVLTHEYGKPEEMKQVIDLKNALAFYENDFLIGLYRQYKGQELEFKTVEGLDLKIKVNEPRDIYTIIINSFKK